MPGAGNETSQADAGRPFWVSPWEREARRKAIVDAAIRFARKHGIKAVTLSAVAEEAGIARSTIYSYFTGKKELLAELPPLDEAAEAARPAPIAGEAEFGRGEATGELEMLARRVLIPKSMLKGGTDSAIASLEMRLGVIEKTFAETEKRADGTHKETAERIASVEAAIGELKQRAEDFAEKQQWALAGLRLEIHNLEHPPAKEEKPAVPPCEIPLETAAEEQAEPQTPAADRVATAAAPPPNYLTAARRAAKDAAVEAAVAKARGGRMKRRVRSWFVGAAGLAIAAGCALAYLHMDGTERAHASTPPRPVAAAKLDAEAELAQGMQRLNGDGQPIDLEGGVKLIAEAARDGEPRAQAYLAMLYRTGTGVDADMAKAVAWDRAAAHQGNVGAMAELGKAYAGGWSGNTDYARAANWLGKAARYGNIDAAFDLAVLYERGAGVPQSIADAFIWYSIAAKEGDGAAAARAKVLAGELDAAALTAAEQNANAFSPLVASAAANKAPRP